MSAPPSSRFVALDVHKSYIVVGAVDATQTIILAPRRVTMAQFDEWAKRHLLSTDQVVLETTTNAWDLYDRLVPLVERVVVADPTQVKVIAASFVKTDKRDTLALARLLAAHLIPEVWVPPPEVRELRALVAHRQRLMKQRTMAKNRLQSLLHRHNVVAPATRAFAANHQAWWKALAERLTPSERLRLEQDQALIAYLTPLIETVEQELARLSQQGPWKKQVPYLVQVPGINLLAAMTILAAVGQIERFPTAKHLVGYAGLGTRVHASGQVNRSGKITKRGRADLRTILVEAAWAAVRVSPWWRARFTQLTARMEPGKAIVAIARKLLVVLWNVLTDQVADRQADAMLVARSLFRWAADYRLAPQMGLSRMAFVRLYLDQLGVGQDLTHMTLGGKAIPLHASG